MRFSAQKTHSVSPFQHPPPSIARILLLGISNDSVPRRLRKHGYECFLAENIDTLDPQPESWGLILVDHTLLAPDPCSTLDRIFRIDSEAPVCICQETPADFSSDTLEVTLQGTADVLYYGEIDNGLFIKRMDNVLVHNRLKNHLRKQQDHLHEQQRLHRELSLQTHVADHERELNANILASIGSGVIILDPKGLIMLLNNPARSILGCGQDALLGRPYTRLFPKALSRVVTHHLALKTDKVSEVDRLRIGHRHLQVSSYTMLDSRHRPSGLLLFLQDITKQEETQLQLYRAEKLATIGTMMSGISHELRNPLAIISARCQMVLAKGDITPQTVQHAFESIQNQTERSAQIVNGVLDFTRQRSGQAGYHTAVQILEEALSYVQYQNAFDAIAITRQIDPEAEVFGDRSRYVQVFLNLLSNAADAIAGKGTIQLGISRTERSTTIIEVVDDGPGIDTNVLPKITDPFFTTKDPGKGTGLGLAIVNKVVNESGGRLQYRSLPGETVFVVELPSSRRKPHV